MRVFHGVYTRISGWSVIGAVAIIAALCVVAGVRASSTHAAGSIDYSCDNVTNTMMEDKMPVQFGYQLHIKCADPNVTIIDPNNNSYLQFQVVNPLDSTWWLYDLKFVSRDYTNKGDFSFSWYDDCVPSQPTGTQWNWRAGARLTFHYEDGKWISRSYTTGNRWLKCDPGGFGTS